MSPPLRDWQRQDRRNWRQYATKWGSYNNKARHIRLNTERAKTPKDLLEYVLVHELAHLIAPTHSERFVALMKPTWREAQAELNALPLSEKKRR